MLQSAEVWYPLRLLVCTECWLVQTEDYACSDELFTADYAYFSSVSSSWLSHAEQYVKDMVERFALTSESTVVEVAANDGYLLQFFAERGIPVLGIEPASNVALAARDKGIESIQEFFGRNTARDLAGDSGPADLLIANNVLGRVPNLDDFVGGSKILLAKGGVLTMEFPHLMQIVERNQFDSIYHEHLSYLGFSTVERIFAQHGIVIFDVEELPTHGGSLRIFGRHAECDAHPVQASVRKLRERESRRGMDSLAYYARFGERVRETKRALLEFLIEARRSGRSVVGYGAPAKGNALLNYCGILQDFLDYTVDRNPDKQGCFTPGTRIPILDPARIFETRPDYVLILSWSQRDEIMEQLAGIREWKGQFVVAIPEVQILP